MLNQNKHNISQQGIDEQDAVQSHQQLYGNNGGSQQAGSQQLGMGAAMQALKMFQGGSGQSSGTQGGQNQFIGMAMGEASKVSPTF